VSEPPSRDLIDLARRFRGLAAGTASLARETPYGYAMGDREEFAVLDLGEPSVTRIGATVRSVTEHAYFFVQEGRPVSAGTMDRIGRDFEEMVYPKVTAAFGSEWTPGVDSDPRITILHADLTGAAGYYNGADEHPRAVESDSNEREMVYLSASYLDFSAVAYNSLLAHEFQHMIHWRADSDEDSWVNEGLAQVAATLVGGGGNWRESFLGTPDTQLTFWPELEDSKVHYAAAESFLGYLLDHYGGRGNASLLAQQAGDSIAGVEAYLDGFGARFIDVFADWTAANLLDEPDGPYSHAGIDARTDAKTAVRSGTGEGAVNQFAADYLEVEPEAGSGTLIFEAPMSCRSGSRNCAARSGGLTVGTPLTRDSLASST